MAEIFNFILGPHATLIQIIDHFIGVDFGEIRDVS